MSREKLHLIGEFHSRPLFGGTYHFLLSEDIPPEEMLLIHVLEKEEILGGRDDGKFLIDGEVLIRRRVR